MILLDFSAFQSTNNPTDGLLCTYFSMLPVCGIYGENPARSTTWRETHREEFQESDEFQLAPAFCSVLFFTIFSSLLFLMSSDWKLAFHLDAFHH